MKILIVIGCYYPATCYGGPIFSTLGVSRGLANIGHEVYVATTNANGYSNLDVSVNTFVNFENNLKIKYYGNANHRGFSWDLLLHIWRDIRTSDVVFLQPIFSSYVPVTLFYSFLFCKPVLLSPRGSLSEWSLRQKRYIPKMLWLKLLIAPFANQIKWHAASKREQKSIESLFPHASVTVIPNGIDPHDFKAHKTFARNEYTQKYTGHESNASPAIVSMGRLHQSKGFDILILAFEIVKETFDSAILMIAGTDGGEKDALQALINSRNLHNSVYLVGELTGEEKINFLANADLFVLPSHSENFGNVYLESLAVGTPVIASKNTPWENLEELQCGMCVNNTAKDTANAILEMLSKDLRALGINGKRHVDTSFSWSMIAEQFIDTFSMMLNNNRHK